jgi:hypothetical protein
MSEQEKTARDIEYEAIEEAIMQNPRGRWFLNEYARRNRAADTDRLVDAIEHLYRAALDKNTVAPTHTSSSNDDETSANLEVIRRALGDMRQQIKTARIEMANVRPHETMPGSASADVSADVVASTERATLDILAAVERLQEIADTLRTNPADDDICDEIETHARGIFMSSAYQNMTGQRIAHLMSALTALDNRISGILTLDAFSDD